MGYEITFFPVGNGERSGDTIVLRFGNLFGQRIEQRVVVIDGGYTDTGEAIVEFIKAAYGTAHVDLVISTHPDADHAGGLAVVLEQLSVGQLWMHLPWNHCDDISRMFKDGRVTDASVEEALRKSLDAARDLERIATRRKIPIVEPFTGVVDTTGNIYVAGPSQDYYESLLPSFRGTPEPKEDALSALLKALTEGVKEAIRKVAERWDFETLDDKGETSAENNSSAIILLRTKGDDCGLFTGDAGIPALTLAADHLSFAGFNFDRIKIIQLPHHGSQRNVGPTILDRLIGPRQALRVRLRDAIVSAGPDGAPKHPSKKVTNAFLRRGAPVFATLGKSFTFYHQSPRTFTQGTPLPFYEEVEE